MFGAILKATNSFFFQKGMTFCRSIYVKKVMKLLAFIFEQPSYVFKCNMNVSCCFLSRPVPVSIRSRIPYSAVGKCAEIVSDNGK